LEDPKLSKENGRSILSQVGLEELRRTYDQEIERKQTLETKAATVLGFATLVITILTFILGFFFTNNFNKFELLIYAILVSISVIILAISIYFLIKVFLVTRVSSPFRYDVNEIRHYLERPSDKLENDLLLNYGRSVGDYYNNNEEKADSLKYATILLPIGVLIAIIPPLIVFWLKVLR